MATWYVRPDTSHGATRDGTSYETAWGGWTEAVWGASGIAPGDTLYVCGAHTYSAIVEPGAHGATVDNRATIRGDYADDLGSITFGSGTYYLNLNDNYTTVSNLTINAGDYACIVLGGTPLVGVHVRDCVLSAAGAASGSLLRLQGFNGWSYKDIVINGNAFSGGSGSSGGGAIQWYATSSTAITSLSNIQITNNTFADNTAARATILFKALDTVPVSVKMADIVVSGNTFDDCGAVAIELYGPDVYGRNTGVKVCENVIRNQTEVGELGGGISLGGFGPSLTSGFGANIVARNSGYEILGVTGMVNLFYGTYRVFDNFADGLDTTTIDGNGVLFDHGCDNCVAYGNEFRNLRGTGAENYYSGGFGILVLDATNCTAYGNVVVNCVTGVAFGNEGAGQSADIFNNNFLNCSQAGAYLVGGAATANNLVRNNKFTASRTTLSVKNNAATWTGEESNRFYGFGISQGHTLHASTQTAEVDPEINDPGIYLGGKDFTGKAFYDPPNIGAVEVETPTPRYAITKR